MFIFVIRHCCDMFRPKFLAIFREESSSPTYKNEMFSGRQPRRNAKVSLHFKDWPRPDHQGSIKPTAIPWRLGRCQCQKYRRNLTFRRCRLPESISLSSVALKASRSIWRIRSLSPTGTPVTHTLTPTPRNSNASCWLLPTREGTLSQETDTRY
jgi:hypothetical protein